MTLSRSERVQRGATFLDGVKSGWRASCTSESTTIALLRTEALALGAYMVGAKGATGAEAHAHVLSLGLVPSEDDDRSALMSEWQGVIAER